MPNRILKESINDSRGLGRASPFAQDLYKRLITYADDYGRFNTDLDIMRARLYARELEAVSPLELLESITELVGEGKIKIYTTSNHKGDLYGYFPNWKDHNRIRNTRAKFPEPETEINDWYLKRFIPIELKTQIFLRDNFTCQLCKKDFSLPSIPFKEAIRLLSGALHIDHIVPVTQGGRATEENLRLLCASCNLSRPRLLSPQQLAANVTLIPPIAETCGNPPPIAETCGLIQSNKSNPTIIQSESNNKAVEIIKDKTVQRTKPKVDSSPFGEKLRELFARIDKERGYALSVKRKAEAASMMRMLKKEYTTDQIIKTWQDLKAEPFYSDKELTMMTVEGQIGAKLNGKSGNNQAGYNQKQGKHSQSIPGNRPAGAFDDIAT
jgi:hypothetical protein